MDPYGRAFFLNGKLPACTDDNGVNIEIRLYHYDKRIEFYYSMIKLPVTTPESIYIAFPFYLDGSKLIYEAQGGIVEPGVNQLEGTASDWNVIQHFASVKNTRPKLFWEY